MPFVFANELTPRSVEWLWPGRIALGHLGLLDGDPDRGKSLLMTDLCSRLTTGRPWPDGAPAAGPANVIIMNAEDGTRDTILSRLAAAGADMARVALWDRQPGEAWFRLPGQVAQLDDLLARTAAKLVVLDPLTAFLDSRLNLASETAVRQALVPLADLAAKHRCAMELLRHLNKAGGGRALYRGLHSIAFVAACRTAWLVGRDPKIRRQYVLAPVKNNLDAPQASLAYAITSHASGAAQVEWRGPSTWSDDDLVAAASTADRRLVRACAFVSAFLKDGPRLAADILKAARRQGISRRTVYRARGELEIRRQRIPGDRRASLWLLPGQEVPPEFRPQANSVDAILERLEKQFPRRPDDDDVNDEAA